MKYNEILSLSEVVGEGFFADKVVNLLDKRKAINKNDEILLGEVLNFVEKAKKGRRQVESGRLGSDALDSIGAYRRAIRIIAAQTIEQGLEHSAKQAFQAMLDGIKVEVITAMEDKSIDPASLEKTRSFFEKVRQQTLSEASKYYSKKVEVISWPSLLY
jgi:hypothetical protein